MNWIKKLAIALGILLLISACQHSPEQRANWVTNKIASKLDLNADQKAKLDAVKQTLLDIRKNHESDRIKSLDEVKQMILADHLDAAKMKELMARRQKIMDENFDTIFSKVSAFHDSLTPEQKKKAVDLINKFESQWD